MRKQLVINLSNNDIQIKEVDNEFIIEENDLSFESPVLCGYGVIGLNRLKVISGDVSSKVGGYFAHYMKSNSYDNILIKGKSSKPVFIYIDKSNIEIKDASDFYLSNVKESENIIKDKLKENKIEIASIGLAGVKQVEFSRIMFDNNKSCGKNGLGRLMGEKKLKAIVLKKQEDSHLTRDNSVKEINKSMCENMKVENIESFFSDENYCYGCNINCKSTSIKKLMIKGYSEEFSKKLDYLCNDYGMDSFIFAEVLDEMLSLEKNIQKVINKEYAISIKDSNKKKEKKLDEAGFCKFLINKNIITEEELEKLLKDLNLK